MGISPEATESGGVEFKGTLQQLYSANLSLRTANRIVVRVAEFPARAFYELERKAKRLPWGDYLTHGIPSQFRVTTRKSKLYHQNAIVERLGNVVREAGFGVSGGGEEEDAAVAGQLFLVRIVRDMVTISADSSGELLHRRGYRQATGKAPLRETLAAAMLLGAGYAGTGAIFDPFCGSGTIPIEAALMARRIAPGLRRRFAFERWPGFDAGVWQPLKGEAQNRTLPAAAAPIAGSDRDTGVVTSAQQNAERAGVGADITFGVVPMAESQPPYGPGLLVTNPPYGVRVSEGADLRNLYGALGNKFRGLGEGWTVAVLSADPTLTGQLGLSMASRWESQNGGIPVRLLVGG